MRQQAKLTIVFPVYQSHQMLERAFCALRDQTFKDFKVIIIDDASPKGYEELADRFRPFFDITIDRNPKNLGAKDNMWKSIHYPTDSEYLFSHHVDDFLKTDYLERAVGLLENDHALSFALTGPEWVHADIAYRSEEMHSHEYSMFTASQFVYNLLHFAPYMFGSVIYRVKHSSLVTEWSYPLMHGYFDRHFLTSILDVNDSKGVYLEGNGIFERDHSLDTHDDRGDEDTSNDAINLLAFYKSILQKGYGPSVVNVLITNQTLFFFRNFENRESFRSFYQKQKLYNLIQWSFLRGLGIFSLLTMHLNARTKRRMTQSIRKLRATF